MVNILVPTDFSDLSRVAIQFAMKVANKMNGNVTLLHVLTVIQPTRASMRLRYRALEMDLIEFAQEDFAPLVKEAEKLNKTSNPVKFKIEKGQSFNDTVKRFAKKNRSGLVIMGTKGASGLKKYVLGSNTSSLIEISHIPVLVVPEQGDFKAFKNVVYATDLSHLDRELKALLPYLEIFDAHLHVLHVVPKGKNIEPLKEKIAKAWQKIGYKKLTVSIKESDDIEKAIDAYVHQINADLITLFTSSHNFYEKLFNRSLTRRVAFQSKVPLLAFK